MKSLRVLASLAIGLVGLYCIMRGEKLDKSLDKVLTNIEIKVSGFRALFMVLFKSTEDAFFQEQAGKVKITLLEFYKDYSGYTDFIDHEFRKYGYVVVVGTSIITIRDMSNGEMLTL